MKSQSKPGRPSDDVWSAPESGTVRDPTSGNQPSQSQVSDNPPLLALQKNRSHARKRPRPATNEKTALLPLACVVNQLWPLWHGVCNAWG
jgi:hypothetical protein